MIEISGERVQQATSIKVLRIRIEISFNEHTIALGKF